MTPEKRTLFSLAGCGASDYFYASILRKNIWKKGKIKGLISLCFPPRICNCTRIIHLFIHSFFLLFTLLYINNSSIYLFFYVIHLFIFFFYLNPPLIHSSIPLYFEWMKELFFFYSFILHFVYFIQFFIYLLNILLNFILFIFVYFVCSAFHWFNKTSILLIYSFNPLFQWKFPSLLIYFIYCLILFIHPFNHFLNYYLNKLFIHWFIQYFNRNNDWLIYAFN